MGDTNSEEFNVVDGKKELALLYFHPFVGLSNSDVWNYLWICKRGRWLQLFVHVP